MAGLLFSNGIEAHHFSPTLPDSTGVENKNGKTFVIHRVNAGQTLYAVMRRYKTTLQAIKEANPGLKDNLVTGQIVRVPVQGGKSAASTPPKPKPIEKNLEVGKTIVIKPIDTKPEPKSEERIVIAPETPKEIKKEEKAAVAEPKIVIAEQKKEEAEAEKADAKPVAFVPAISKNGLHRVESGQSLYGVAVKYGVLMADIRRWNNLGNDQLRSGQDIIVSEQGYLDYLKKAKPDSVKVAETKKAPAEKIALPPKPTDDPTNGNLPETRLANSGARLVEMGTAEVIDALDNSNKYLALHRTAPVGSLVQVKNVSNGQSVWVKVIGKLPAISMNNRIIIKLSARAYEKLSPEGRRFSAEINYLAQ